jgi:FKBP-type peptidyl-prolyl cis-trans isomerase FkpA
MQPRVGALLCLAVLALPAAADEPATASQLVLRSSHDKILYALGLSLAEQIGDFELSPAELALVEAGLRDGASGASTAVSLAQWAPRVEKLLARRRELAAQRERERARAYLASAAREPGAVRRGSGLIYRELRPGSGEAPTAASRVRVHYSGTHVDGTVFDSSAERGQPSQFALGSVIKCWTEGVQLMRPGGKARLVCPPELAYGQRGMPGKIKPGETLTFEIELLEVLPSAPAAADEPGA